MRRRRLPLDYAVRNLGRRPLRTLLTAVSSALVAALLVATTAFVGGLGRSFAGAGEDDTAILLSTASQRDLVRSSVSPAVPDLVAASVRGVAESEGTPEVSAEIHMGTNVRLGERPADGAADPSYPAFVRGVTDRAFLVHDAVTLVLGRPPRSGEVIAGRLVPGRLGVDGEALAVGRKIRFEGSVHTISGIFAAPGTTVESEIWAPLHELKGEARRDDVSAVFVRLRSKDAFSDLDLFTKRRLDLELLSIPSRVYYEELAAWFTPIRGLAWLLAAMIAAAALFGGANTLSAAVQDRVRELATLRSIGYPIRAIVRSLLEESVIVAAAGGLAGLAAARLLVSGSAVSIAMSAFALEVDAASIAAGFAGVLAIGALGTIPAALKVARMTVAAALKES